LKLHFFFIHLSNCKSLLRKSEVDTMRAILKKELHQVILEPRSPKAFLCGSDVLFTGREFFVGLSTHTNTEGAVAVASTWPEYPCTPIKVTFDCYKVTRLHLIVTRLQGYIWSLQGVTRLHLIVTRLQGYIWSLQGYKVTFDSIVNVSMGVRRGGQEGALLCAENKNLNLRDQCHKEIYS
jgi:hypothetical protein